MRKAAYQRYTAQTQLKNRGILYYLFSMIYSLGVRNHYRSIIPASSHAFKVAASQMEA